MHGGDQSAVWHWAVTLIKHGARVLLSLLYGRIYTVGNKRSQSRPSMLRSSLTDPDGLPPYLLASRLRRKNQEKSFNKMVDCDLCVSL